LPDIPAFFNKIDFFGTLLPGYIAVILYLALIRPDLMLAITGEEPQFSFDLFFAVVFLVAGPAVGYTVRQFHRYVYAIAAWITTKITKKTTERQDIVNTYAEIRVHSSSEEKLELDQAESAYDFSISTSIVLFVIGLYCLFLTKFNIIAEIGMFILGFVLLMGGFIERKESYTPIYNSLCMKHDICSANNKTVK